MVLSPEEIASDRWREEEIDRNPILPVRQSGATFMNLGRVTDKLRSHDTGVYSVDLQINICKAQSEHG